MAAMAICAHFLLDTGTNPYRKMRTQFSSSILVDDVEQETIGKIFISLSTKIVKVKCYIHTIDTWLFYVKELR